MFVVVVVSMLLPALSSPCSLVERPAPQAGMHEVVSQTMATVRRDRPVHLLGIGSIADIFHGVR